jgi:dTDP-4-amino-4,6-dideoxygalactose transaminase
MLKKLTRITNSRIKNAKFYDEYLKEIPEITIPARSSAIKQVFHLYMIVCENRDELQKFLISHGIDAKIHYPTPLHLQPAAKQYNYKKGDFPISEKITKNVLSLPVHEFITLEQKIKVIKLIKKFYSKL